MMKKEYITPQMRICAVLLEHFIADSLELDDDPNPDVGWNDQEARESNFSFDDWGGGVGDEE